MSLDQEALLDWLTCFECVKRAQLRDAEGWVIVQRSVNDGDTSDGDAWKCPDCATPSEEWEAEQRWNQALAAAED